MYCVSMFTIVLFIKLTYYRLFNAKYLNCLFRAKVRMSNITQHKLRTLYNTVRNYTDAKGRQLSSIFMKLPLKTELPEYYEVIKKPLGLEKIGVRLKNGVYETLEDLLSDLILMLDNACKYNEPDSQIYKDALTLQQIALQTKIELTDDSGIGVPDVKAIIQELLTNLFSSVYNHQVFHYFYYLLIYFNFKKKI